VPVSEENIIKIQMRTRMLNKIVMIFEYSLYYPFYEVVSEFRLIIIPFYEQTVIEHYTYILNFLE
jgi:hypothetical protein